MSDDLAYANGSLTDVCGVVVYVGPLETDFCAGGMREVAIVDCNHHPVFLRFFVEFAHRYENQFFLAEQNNSVLMASNMKIMHASKSFDSTDATTLQFDPRATCLEVDIFEGVKAHVRSGTSIQEYVKRLVLYRRGIYEGHVDPMAEPPSKKIKYESSRTPTSSMKYLFGYITEGMTGATKMDDLD